MITVSIGQGAGISPDFTTFAAFWATVPSTVLDDYTVNLLWASSANEFVDHNPNLTGKDWGDKRLIIQAGSGMSFRDNVNKTTNPLRYSNTAGACWKVNNSGERCLSFNTGKMRLSVYGIQFKCASSGSHNNRCIEALDTYEEEFDYNIFEGGGNFATLLNHLTGGPTGSGAYNRDYIGKIRRNVFHAVSSTCYGLNSRRWNKTQLTEFYGNTIYCSAAGSSGIGMYLQNTSGANEYRIANNAVAGFGTDLSAPAVTGGLGVAFKDYNATDKASGSSGFDTGSNNQYSLTPSTEWENVTTATADFRVKNTAVKLFNTGSSDYGIVTDIIGQNQAGIRDIGAFENQTGGPPPAWPFLKRRNMEGGFARAHSNGTL